MKYLILLLVVSLLGSTVACAEPLHSEPIRVAVVNAAESVRVDGDGILATDDQGMPLRLQFPVQIGRNRDRLLVQGQSLREIHMAGPGIIRVNGKGYRGLIQVSPGERGILVVDELPLEEYLVGLIKATLRRVGRRSPE